MDGTVQLTYNARILMGEDDRRALEAFLRDAQCAYNECASFMVRENTPTDIKSVHDAVYGWMRSHYPNLPAQCVIRIYKEVLAAIRSIRANKHENAKTPQRKHLAMRLDKRLYANMTVEGISLSGFAKGKRQRFVIQTYPKIREMLASYTTSDPLIFMRDGEAWLAVPFNVPAKPLANGDGVGIDLGMRRFVVTSDGIVIDDKAYKAKRRKVRYLKRCLKAKGTKSAKRHLKKLARRERNLSRDFRMRAAKAVLEATEGGVIVMEDLKKMKQRTSKTDGGWKRTRHNSALSQVALAAFKDTLSYKAQLAGRRVETVSPKWTSQTDSRSGKRDGERRGCRYVCSDGVVLDADWNAALNIVMRSRRPHSSVVPFDGALRPYGLQATQSTGHYADPLGSASR